MAVVKPHARSSDETQEISKKREKTWKRLPVIKDFVSFYEEPDYNKLENFVNTLGAGSAIIVGAIGIAALIRHFFF